MQYGIWPKVFVCSNCSKEMKKTRGCKKERKKPILEVECVCNGDKHCDLCKGKNKFALKECPAKMNNQNVNRFLPFFFHWKTTGFLQFPDGRGRYFQPYKMLEAFALCANLSAKQEQKEAEKARAR